ncbi:MAG: DUF3786 domain-containing protein [Oscillospiraceae bacterium]
MEQKIPDNKNNKPLEHYRQQFGKLTPEAMAMRSGFVYDREAFAFRMRFLGREVAMSYPDMRLSYVTGEAITRPDILILLSRALIEGLGKAGGGKFLAYSEVPWGNVYLQQFRGRCLMRLAFGFGYDLEKFCRACEALGGVACSGGDKGYDIAFLDDLCVRLLIWAGDDEFPPSAQILFSDNFPAMFTAEDMAVVGDILISAMKSIK